MISIDGETADQVWRAAAVKLRAEGARQASREEDTTELLHVALSIRDPRQRLVFGHSMNPAFAVAEVLWIMAGRNDLSFLQPWNPRMANYSDNRRRMYGAYGHRLRHHFGGLDQLVEAYRTLEDTPNSRQVVLQIWDPVSDLPRPKPRSKDIPCNVLAHLMVRRGRLEWFQVMRSNDIFWGLPYNIVHFTVMQEIMAGWLNLEVGTYNHVSDSLHAYQRHWPVLDSVEPRWADAPKNTTDLRLPFKEWQALWPRLLSATEVMAAASDPPEILEAHDALGDVPIAHRQCVAVLAAEALRRKGFIDEGEKVASLSGPYWSSSWRQWSDSIGKRRNAL